MEIDPMEAVEKAMEERDAKEEQREQKREQAQKRKDRLNAMIAVTIALLASFLGICKVKADNINQAMQLCQADKIDHWAWFQARNIRQDIYLNVADQLRVQARLNGHTVASADGATTPTIDPKWEAAAKTYEDKAARQQTKMEEVKEKAEGFQKRYEELDTRDDQFDLMDAALSIAISLLAIASLTQSYGLYFVALVPGTFGFFMGLAGLFGWAFHPEKLTALLGA